MVAVDSLTVSPTAVASLDEQLAASREHRIIRSPRGWEVLRYEDSLHALRDPALQRAKLFLWRADNIDVTEGYARDFLERTLNTQEGEKRKHLRTPMARLLSPRRSRTLQDDIRDIVTLILDELENLDDVDFIRDVCWRLPALTYCAMVSIPYAEGPRVARLSDSSLAPLLTMEKHRKPEFEAAYHELFEVVEEHIEQRRANLSDDFTSALIEEEMAGNLSRQEVYDVGVNLLQASVDNTVHQSALVIGQLLAHGEQWTKLLDEPTLLPNAVEEVIRMWPRFRTHMRYAVDDMELYGADVKKDDLIFIHVVASQYDESVFEDPQTFDITRSMHPGPLVFGQGQYSCIGQHLSRIEMHELLQAVIDRFPHARLLEFEEHEGPFVREVTRLRVSLTGK